MGSFKNTKKAWTLKNRCAGNLSMQVFLTAGKFFPSSSHNRSSFVTAYILFSRVRAHLQLFCYRLHPFYPQAGTIVALLLPPASFFPASGHNRGPNSQIRPLKNSTFQWSWFIPYLFFTYIIPAHCFAFDGVSSYNKPPSLQLKKNDYLVP